MKALIQQLGTGLYFKDPASWTIDPDQAFDFTSSANAWSYCTSLELDDVQIVLKFDPDKYDIILPAKAPMSAKGHQAATARQR